MIGWLSRKLSAMVCGHKRNVGLQKQFVQFGHTADGQQSGAGLEFMVCVCVCVCWWWWWCGGGGYPAGCTGVMGGKTGGGLEVRGQLLALNSCPKSCRDKN